MRTSKQQLKAVNAKLENADERDYHDYKSGIFKYKLGLGF